MEDDKRSIYNRSGLGHRIGYGKRPALLVVDMQIGFTAPEKSPLAGNLDAQVAAINKLIPAARKKGVPIVFTVVGYDPKVPGDGGLWPEKAPPCSSSSSARTWSSSIRASAALPRTCCW